MPHSTDELMKLLQKKRSLRSFLQETQDDFVNLSLDGQLNNLLSQHRLKKSEVIRDAHLDRIYGYQLFNGEKAAPSRDKLLRLVFAMRLTVPEAQTLLRAASLPILYPRNRRDALLLFALGRRMTLYDCDALLSENGEPDLEDNLS